ncbi:nucleotidyl transferase AbiEii/AbiGii toxin family protein [Azospirillum sp. TSO22-1]|uniref:nucleotidyl transferase AbiEii/AbiGii toxin family protein n=1 Tax=Azospirillum sp. TSO22-1 TaxID=716789 RepID=UPI0013048816|nr:nucleotidyl transferase AbiEii/AbiGii toxin family protein [Azospirillum sp. TSO22-1]
MIDSLKEPPVWTFGGGTALAVHLAHRISYDIDAFVPNSDVVRDLTPARNPVTRELLGGRKFEYPGQYLKLNLAEGEIDFIVGGRRTEAPYTAWEFEGRSICLETPWEIAIKKVFYRPSTFKVRDIFDVAAVLEHHPDALWTTLPEVEDKLDKVIDRISHLMPVYEAKAADDINPTEHGRRYMDRSAPENVLAFLSAWKAEPPPPLPSP